MKVEETQMLGYLFYSEPSPLIGTTLVKELSLSLLQSFKI